MLGNVEIDIFEFVSLKKVNVTGGAPQMFPRFVACLGPNSPPHVKPTATTCAIPAYPFFLDQVPLVFYTLLRLDLEYTIYKSLHLDLRYTVYKHQHGNSGQDDASAHAAIIFPLSAAPLIALATWVLSVHIVRLKWKR